MCELEYQALDICHADGLLTIWSDSDVIKYTNMRLPCTLDDVKSRIEIFKPFDVFAVIQSKEVIGIIGCPPIEKGKMQYGLFYQLCKSSWGQGNATIATKWILEYMDQKYKTVTLFADVVIDNVASEKILQKFGFKLISEETIKRDDEVLKIHNYQLSPYNVVECSIFEHRK